MTTPRARPLLLLAALAAATEPDLGRSALERVKEGLRARHRSDPMGSTVTAVLLATVLFYRAERRHNPKIETLNDALVYVSTNLSVGHGDILASTPAGKAIGSALRTFGPAMATRILDEPGGANAAVVERLDEILAVLERRATT